MHKPVNWVSIGLNDGLPPWLVIAVLCETFQTDSVFAEE